MDLSCTASYTMTNATIVSGATQYVSQDGNGANQRVLTTGSTVLTARQLPVYTTTDLFVGVYLGLDPSEWTPGLSLATNEPSCVMTLVTNIV
ncbi:unnamed protein product [Sphagnum jensenii]|uniref:Uncharacterized protein n=1 Tax=Sphagnum jensenii TaxID=128206 RepID=A0ABP0VDQ0_9BRYO